MTTSVRRCAYDDGVGAEPPRSALVPTLVLRNTHAKNLSDDIMVSEISVLKFRCPVLLGTLRRRRVVPATLPDFATPGVANNPALVFSGRGPCPHPARAIPSTSRYRDLQTSTRS